MADHGCTNGSLDGVDYSSPLPVIGLYIAAASAVCMLMMLWDIGAATFSKKSWLPCKAFKLNSVTLVLLGVAAKLPLDLTSSMPSPEDQLSKLSGLVIICISMVFFVPSLGVGNESESFTNMVALSIFVITVAANICIQLGTGVIVLFYTEHIIVLVLMLVLLILLWHILLVIRNEKKISGDECKALLARGTNTSMLGRLQVCYLYSYCSNPQFAICKNPMYASVSIGSVTCAVILLQAAFRSVILRNLKYCLGHSDYGWSVTFILVTQILTVLVGTSAIICRWLTLFRRMVFEKMAAPFNTNKNVIQRNQTLGKLYRLRIRLISLSIITSSIIQIVIVAPSMVLRKLFRLYKVDKSEHFDQDNEISAKGYILRKGVGAMMKFTDSCPKGTLRNLLQLFLDQQNSGGGSSSVYRPLKQMEVCCISVELTLLVKIVEVSIPEGHFGLIPIAFKEVNAILHFIDYTLQRRSSGTRSKLSYAKALATDGNFSSLLTSKDLDGKSEFDCAVAVVKKLQEKLQYDSIVGREVYHILRFVNPESRSTIEELSNCMKQMFIVMVQALICQLPIAIYTCLSETYTEEEFQSRAKFGMSYLLQIASTSLNNSSLKDQIRWKFPPADILSLGNYSTPTYTTPKDPLKIFHELVSPM